MFVLEDEELGEGMNQTKGWNSQMALPFSFQAWESAKMMLFPLMKKGELMFRWKVCLWLVNVI